MPYDARLAGRVRRSLARRKGIAEKKMFGGLAFLLDGKMFCGVLKDDLVVRAGRQRYEKALSRAHTRPMDFTGRPLTGYIYVGPKGTKTPTTLARWVREAIDFVSSLSEVTR